MRLDEHGQPLDGSALPPSRASEGTTGEGAAEAQQAADPLYGASGGTRSADL
eukprot:COSAG05_NODE_355_length_10856_cov_7.197174_16_plen_52_part_00